MAQEIVNNWTKWHRKSMVLHNEDEQDKFFMSYPAPYKTYNDPSTMKGDVIEKTERNVTVKLSQYKCPHCFGTFRTEEGAQQHVTKFLLGTRNHPKMKFSDLLDEEIQEELGVVTVYYEVVKPVMHRMSPKSIEWDGVTQLSRNSKIPPTPEMREARDKRMETWREKRRTSVSDEDRVTIKILPNGDIQEKGSNGKFYYWCPQAYLFNQWSPISIEEFFSYRESKLYPMRVLNLLAIVPNDVNIKQGMLGYEYTE